MVEQNFLLLAAGLDCAPGMKSRVVFKSILGDILLPLMWRRIEQKQLRRGVMSYNKRGGRG
jgi:hypothetical protein